MTLEAAAQLLSTALMVIQSVSANPSLPQSVRENAEATAEHAITEATRAIGFLKRGGASQPSCTIASDKYNYRVGEVVVFDYAAANATSFEFIPDTSGKGGFPVPEGELIGVSGQYRKVTPLVGYPYIAMKAKNAAGQGAVCSAMVHVH